MKMKANNHARGFVPLLVGIFGAGLQLSCSASAPTASVGVGASENLSSANEGALKAGVFGLEKITSQRVDEDAVLTIPLRFTGRPRIPVYTEIMTPPAHGSIAVDNVKKTITYKPSANYFGDDTFSVRGAQGLSITDSQDVAIVVNPVDDPPECVSHVFGIKGLTAGSDYEGVISCFDIDSKDVSIQVSEQPKNGTLTLAGMNFKYHMGQAAADDQFVIKATADGKSSQAVTYSFKADVLGETPIARNATSACKEDTQCTVALAAESLPGSLGLAYILDGIPKDIDGELNARTGVLTYQGKKDWNGKTDVKFKLFNGTFYSQSAVISITIDAVNDRPALELQQAGDVTIAEGTSQKIISFKASDDDSIPKLQITKDGGPSNGTVTIEGTNALYKPKQYFNGVDYFTVEACEGKKVSPLCSEVVKVSVIVTPVNDSPIAPDKEISLVVDENKGPFSFHLNDFGVSDPDAGDKITVTLVSVAGNPIPAGLKVDADGMTLTFKPDGKLHDGETKKIPFAFRVTDKQGATADGSGAVTVVGADNPTTFDPASLVCEGTEDQDVECQVTATDPDGDVTIAVKGDELKEGVSVISPDLIGEKSYQVVSSTAAAGSLSKSWWEGGLSFGSQIELIVDLGKTTVSSFSTCTAWSTSSRNMVSEFASRLSNITVSVSDNKLDWGASYSWPIYMDDIFPSRCHLWDASKGRYWKVSGKLLFSSNSTYIIRTVSLRGPTDTIAPDGKIKLHLGKTPNGQVVVPIKAYGAGAEFTAELKVNVKPVNHPPVLEISGMEFITRAIDNTATYSFGYSDADGDPVTFDIKQVSGTSKVVQTTDVATKTVTLSFSDINCPWPTACSLDIYGSDGKVGGVSNDFRLYIADPAAGILPVTL